MKKLALTSSLLALTIVGCTNTEEYIDPPIPQQEANLQDDDNDGVINARDKCNETPFGAKIDNDGCEEYRQASNEQTLEILFQNNSTEIHPVFHTQIQGMAKFLEKYPETSVELQGFASAKGSNAYNKKLSESRAIVVREQLLALGIERSRIEIVGFGEERSSKSSEPSQIALDRRVEATVIGSKEEHIKEWTIFTTLPK